MNVWCKKILTPLFILAGLLFFTPDMKADNVQDCCNSETCQAQTKGNHKRCNKDKKEMLKEIKEFKVDFLAKEMDLSAAQRKKFAEVYAERMEELHIYMEKSHAIEKRLKNEKNISDEEYAKAMATLDEYRDKCQEIEKKNDAKLKTFLSQKQLFKMREGERKFRDTMHRMKHSTPKKK